MSKQDVPTMEELVKRLKVLEEEKGVLQTLYRYGHSIDYGLEQEWVSLFTRDGVFEIRFRKTGVNHRNEGQEALAKFIASHTRAPEKYHKHLLIEPIINFRGRNKATVESYFLRVDESEGKVFILAFGRYHDRMVKQAGQWRFQERIAEIEALQE